MKKIGWYLLYGAVFVFGSVLIYSSLTAGKQSEVGKKETISKTVETESAKPAEKIQVFLFHATQRCSSCIAIGKFAKETVEQNFQKELNSGKIEFREINIDLPENKEIAAKFKATGSTLRINTIIDGKDDIKEDVKVWSLVSNEQAFVNYLTGKLKVALGDNA